MGPGLILFLFFLSITEIIFLVATLGIIVYISVYMSASGYTSLIPVKHSTLSPVQLDFPIPLFLPLLSRVLHLFML